MTTRSVAVPPFPGAEFDVVARRVNQPSSALGHLLADAAAPELGGRLGLTTGAELQFDAPFGAITSWPVPRWHTHGRLRGGRLHRRVGVEIELAAWSTDASELRLRPTARRFGAWSGRRQGRYFTLAHDAADTIVRRLDAGPVRSHHKETPNGFRHHGNLDRRAS